MFHSASGRVSFAAGADRESFPSMFQAWDYKMECEELIAKVEALDSKNMTLRNEINLIAEEAENLASENESLQGMLRNLQGQDRVGDSEIYGPREIQSQFMHQGGNGYPQVLSKISNLSSSQRDEQRESEMSDSTGKCHPNNIYILLCGDHLVWHWADVYVIRAAGLKNVYKIDHALQSLCSLSYETDKFDYTHCKCNYWASPHFDINIVFFLHIRLSMEASL